MFSYVHSRCNESLSVAKKDGEACLLTNTFNIAISRYAKIYILVTVLYATGSSVIKI